MTRTKVNFLVDAAALAAFALLTATGLVERYLLPPGTGHFQTLWNMNRHQWGEIHFWIALALMATLVVHLALHWKWIACVVRGRNSDASGRRVLLGIIGLVGLTGLSVAPFLSPVQETDETGGRRRQEQSEQVGTSNVPTSDHSIRGSMTLAEVEQQTGVTARFILQELNLPTDTALDINLGKLRRDFGFEMDDVRQVIERAEVAREE